CARDAFGSGLDYW
nr:immunoglobulin heavy chain junction region [Macaca mulatta]MOX59052.1 immunoglobulin heavy chain junction region [Macaca mulatta]MOX59314.1 immunoglobulin heavy chain junction region [Macaca mulatta]MOX60267.1 immunoglobulin heavy chain junction region [Macaca mulatta]MOX61949.1 immunoglobulin heavy chain junction region [Macaca mulatta]